MMLTMLAAVLCAQDVLETGAGWEMRPRVSAGQWFADWDFEVSDLAGDWRIERRMLWSGQLGVGLAFPAGWGGFLDYDYSTSRDLTAHTLTLGASYAWPESLFLDWERLSVRAGALWSRLEVEESDFPGDFEPAFGAMAALDYSIVVSWSVSVGASVGVRWLRYDYDEGSVILDADSKIGGFGVTWSIGATLWF